MAVLMPNAEDAVVDIRKLRDYCLNLEHIERGFDTPKLTTCNPW